MGLDMNLNARQSLWNNDELAATVGQAFPELKGRKVSAVTVELIYWRKANAIHKWFVDNVQNGEDDCNSYYVTHGDLESLRETILKVLESRDPGLLPPASGFFFGSTEVDEWYWKELERTSKDIGQILEDFDDKWDFEYQSSW